MGGNTSGVLVITGAEFVGIAVGGFGVLVGCTGLGVTGVAVGRGVDVGT